MFHRLTCIALWIIFKSFYHFQVRGRECVPRGRPYILAANHASYLDPPVLGAAVTPSPLHYLAKEELFRKKLADWYLRMLNAVPLKRGSSDPSALRTALKILKKYPLVIFPQGTRDADWSTVKAGLGFLCKHSGVPVVAAYIKGTGDILPRGAKGFKPGKITVNMAIVDTIRPDDTYEQIVAKVVAKIKSLEQAE